MQEIRSNYILIAAGKRFTGKSTIVLKFAEASGKRIIVVNTDFHPLYSDFENITKEELKTTTKKKVIVYVTSTEEASEVADILNKYQSNAFVILEDAKKFINDNVSKEWERLIINHRMRNLELCFMYHFLKYVPNKIANQYNMLILFKTTDSMSNSSLKEKFGNVETIQLRAEKIRSHSNEHYCEVIYDNE
jgi:hypothetical protein